jgi:hypothetical protein
VSPPEVGINLPWLFGAYGHDLGPNQATPDWPVSYDARPLEELLDFLSGFGIRLIRFWLFEQAEGLLTDGHARVTDVDAVFLKNLSNLCQQLKHRGFRVYWTLLDANGIYRNNDHVTRSIMTDPVCADAFGQTALATVLPIVKDVAWGIDICNEPEAAISGMHGNGTDSGSGWDEVAGALEIVTAHVRRLCPNLMISIGSGYSEHRNLRDLPVYRRLGGNLDFLDYHTYQPGRRILHRRSCVAPWSENRPFVLGEVGAAVTEEQRDSPAAWRNAQAELAFKLHRLVDMQYSAAFLWYLSSLDDTDATGLVFGREAGLALHTLRELAQQKSILL